MSKEVAYQQLAATRKRCRACKNYKNQDTPGYDSVEIGNYSA